jgi:hypothetical protein
MADGLIDAFGSIPGITQFPSVDSFRLAGVDMPGKWTLLDARKQFGWQIQMGYGLSGAQVFPIGDKLVVAKFRGEFWTSPDYALYRLLRSKFLKKPVITIGGLFSATALSIKHPELYALGVEGVVVLEVSATIQEEGGLWVAHVDFLQYRPPVLAVPKPKQVIPDVAPTTPTAKTAQEIEQAKLAAQINELQGRMLSKVRP